MKTVTTFLLFGSHGVEKRRIAAVTTF